MRKFEIVYCFTDSKGCVETYEDGLEKYYIEEVEAYNGANAIDKLKANENFKKEPEIVSIKIKEELYERNI